MAAAASVTTNSNTTNNSAPAAAAPVVSAAAGGGVGGGGIGGGSVPRGLGNPFIQMSLPIRWGEWPAASTAPTPTPAALALTTSTAGGAGAAAASATDPAAKAPAFFDNLHAEVIVLRANKILVSNKIGTGSGAGGGGGGGWTEYPLRVSTAEVVDAKLSPARDLLALRIANREVV